MKKYLAYFLFIAICSGCSVISKQYYYVPDVPHQIIKKRPGHSDFKYIYSKIKVTGKTGDSIGSITTSNGFGHPLLMGPLVFPVIPVGGLFLKSSSRFIMELDVHTNDGYFMPMAIDSNNYKRKRDSLNALKIGTRAELTNSGCYLLVNDTLKVPLRVNEYFRGNTKGHSYWITSDIKFRKVKTMKLVTGNAILDATLSKITFKRKSRIKFDLAGPMGY
ncbi:MAG TPA: hypothetical protein VJ844_12610 [Mucilaginibacter sp.]|nr:hypothetical protein [Mucilaginibacter sp.]